MNKRILKMRNAAIVLTVFPLLLAVGCSTVDADSAVSPPASAVPQTTAQRSIQAELSDTVVIPGDRIGPVTRTTNRQALEQIFGAANLSDEEVGMGEGETEPGTVVNRDAANAFTVIWTDETRTAAAGAINFGSAWRTPEGIGIGTSFAELQQKLGAFQLYGFEWDYGGSVVLENTRLSKYYGTLILRVAPTAASMERSPNDYDAVIGDELFPSSSPHFRALDITVEEMAVYLQKQEG
jgi:hypothetical protein